ncbi:MAG: TlpA disulfide reductase family protein [Candidatus Eisenbacteria bacterium]
MTRPLILAPRVALIALIAFGIAACARQPEPQAPAIAARTLDPARLAFTAVPPDSLAAVIASGGAQGTLVNVWASWCEPCREEFPGIIRLSRAYRDRGLRVVLISADFTEDLPNARKFLAEQGVDWPTYYKTGDDQAFIAALSSNWSGSLPGSFVFDAHGVLRDSWEGKASYAAFERRVRPVLSLPELPAGSTDSTTHGKDRS